MLNASSSHETPRNYQFREYAVAGGLMSYGVSLDEAYRALGGYTARILNGEKPADLPVMKSVKFELVINLNFAAVAQGRSWHLADVAR